MIRLQTKRKTATRRKLHRLCAEVMTTDLQGAIASLERFRNRWPKRSNWHRQSHKLARTLSDGAPRFRVFAEGNSKLPFWSFSSLPKYTCPGAGACLDYCYSFRSWRYPGAFFRQVQNTLLLKYFPGKLKDEFQKLPIGSILRLYVDGDIDSVQTLAFWFRLLATRPDVQAYGYSKSLDVFRQWSDAGLPWPSNYALNLSTGSRYDGLPIVSEVARLPIVRGRFVTVPTIGQYRADGFNRYHRPEYHADVRRSARAIHNEPRVFSCPGQCGACLPNGQHACGSDQMRGVLIAIGEH